jgi:hypothetical protein
MLGSGQPQELDGGALRQHAAGVDGDDVIEALGFFHIGGGDQHCELRTLGANVVDQPPELSPRQGIDAGGRFVEDK